MLQTPSTAIEPFLLDLAIQQSKEEQGKRAFVESAQDCFFALLCARYNLGDLEIVYVPQQAALDYRK